VGEHGVTVLELHAKERVGQIFQDYAAELDSFFRHSVAVAPEERATLPGRFVAHNRTHGVWPIITIRGLHSRLCALRRSGRVSMSASMMSRVREL
jgi:hypothetical protein